MTTKKLEKEVKEVEIDELHFDDIIIHNINVQRVIIEEAAHKMDAYQQIMFEKERNKEYPTHTIKYYETSERVFFKVESRRCGFISGN